MKSKRQQAANELGVGSWAEAVAKLEKCSKCGMHLSSAITTGYRQGKRITFHVVCPKAK